METNYEFVKKIVSSAVGMFENSEVSHFVSLVLLKFEMQNFLGMQI